MDNAIARLEHPLDAKTLLSRINARITLLRRWISHHHSDEPYWWARRTTARETQRERAVLRMVANLLHVERAMARGRIHGTRFATLEEQEAWLRAWEDRRCGTAAGFARVPEEATLRLLREGRLPL